MRKLYVTIVKLGQYKKCVSITRGDESRKTPKEAFIL